jgi:hypothetical protein
MTGGRQSLLISRPGISDRPQPPQLLQLTELFQTTRTLQGGRVLSQELRVVTLRKHAQDLERLIRTVIINRMR